MTKGNNEFKIQQDYEKDLDNICSECKEKCERADICFHFFFPRDPIFQSTCRMITTCIWKSKGLDRSKRW